MQKYSFTQQKPIKTMARPVKTGLDYFPLHIDFFDDIRIGALAVQYGAKGQLAAIIPLVHLYKTGYYLLWTMPPASESSRICRASHSMNSTTSWKNL